MLHHQHYATTTLYVSEMNCDCCDGTPSGASQHSLAIGSGSVANIKTGVQCCQHQAWVQCCQHQAWSDNGNYCVGVLPTLR